RKTLVAADEGERAELSVKMATLAAEVLDRPQDAIDLWHGVLSVLPDDGAALRQLAALYERTEQYIELAEITDRMLERASDDAQKVELLRRSARLWTDVLDNHDQA